MEIAVHAGTVSAFNEKAAAKRAADRALRAARAKGPAAADGSWIAQMAHDFPNAVRRIGEGVEKVH